MKKRSINNLIWFVVLVVVLLVASHYDYKYMMEEKESNEVCTSMDSGVN